MSTNHLPVELPPAWTWEPPPTGQDDAGKSSFPQHQPRHNQQQLPREGCSYERELLFEKHLTPSDVGKLNRLVIPKQHAERYFPLDVGCAEKGLLLGFEDESGTAWQFRYSYWTSSQSYVLTKGWSRFVKEKRLHAGDTVLFERWRRSGSERLHIGWRRRGERAGVGVRDDDGAARTGKNAPTGRWKWNPSAGCHAAMPSPSQHRPNRNSTAAAAAAEQGPLLHAGKQGGGRAYEATRAAPAPGSSSRRLRLFGVNLDCGPDQEPEPHS